MTRELLAQAIEELRVLRSELIALRSALQAQQNSISLKALFYFVMLLLTSLYGIAQIKDIFKLQ